MKTIDFAVEYLVRCGEPGARVVIRECIDELATLRDKLKEVEGEREAAEEERDAAVQSCHDMANNMVYHGNSVAWWHSKAAAYRDALGKCWDQLKANGVYCDGNTHVATAIGKLGDDLTQARADLAEMTEKARKYRVALFKIGCNDIFCAEFERDCGKCQTIAREVVKE